MFSIAVALTARAERYIVSKIFKLQSGKTMNAPPARAKQLQWKQPQHEQMRPHALARREHVSSLAGGAMTQGLHTPDAIQQCDQIFRFSSTDNFDPGCFYLEV